MSCAVFAERVFTFGRVESKTTPSKRRYLCAPYPRRHKKKKNTHKGTDNANIYGQFFFLFSYFLYIIIVRNVCKQFSDGQSERATGERSRAFRAPVNLSTDASPIHNTNIAVSIRIYFRISCVFIRVFVYAFHNTNNNTRSATTRRTI